MTDVGLINQEASRTQADAHVVDEARAVSDRLQACRQSDQSRQSASNEAAKFLTRICTMASKQQLPGSLTQAIFEARVVADRLVLSHDSDVYDEVCDAFRRLLARVEAFVAEMPGQRESTATAEGDEALLRVLSARRAREHRIKADASYDLGCVLAPVGKTIFDEVIENSVLKSIDNLGSVPSNNPNEEQDTLPKPPISPDSKSSTESLTVVFQGRLTREAIASAVNDLMTKNTWTVRQAAKIAGVSKGVFESVLYCKATIDKGLEVIDKLGLAHETRFMAIASAPTFEPSVD